MSKTRSQAAPYARDRTASRSLGSERTDMRGRIALLGLVMTLVCLTLMSSEVSQAVEAVGMEKRWHGLLRTQGVLVEESCGILYRISRPGQSGNATVVDVTPEAVTFSISRDRELWERVVPIGRLSYERPR